MSGASFSMSNRSDIRRHLPGSATPASLWAHLTAAAPRTPKELTPAPAMPQDRSSTTIRLLLDDTQTSMEQFSRRVDAVMLELQSAHADIVKTATAYREGSGDQQDLLIETVDRCQKQIQKSIGSPAQAADLQLWCTKLESRVDMLIKSFDAIMMHANAQERSHMEQWDVLQAQSRLLQSLQEQHSQILTTTLPILPLVQRLPLDIDAAKMSLQRDLTALVELPAFQKRKGSRSKLVHRPPLFPSSSVSQKILGQSSSSPTHLTEPALTPKKRLLYNDPSPVIRSGKRPRLDSSISAQIPRLRPSQLPHRHPLFRAANLISSPLYRIASSAIRRTDASKQSNFASDSLPRSQTHTNFASCLGGSHTEIIRNIRSRSTLAPPVSLKGDRNLISPNPLHEQPFTTPSTTRRSHIADGLSFAATRTAAEPFSNSALRSSISTADATGLPRYAMHPSATSARGSVAPPISTRLSSTSKSSGCEHKTLPVNTFSAQKRNRNPVQRRILADLNDDLDEEAFDGATDEED